MAAQPAVCLLLHAHLPFVRHADDPYHLEEAWLYEALAGCYVPLLMLCEAWQRDGLAEAARLTLSVSPTLAAMLDDELLRARFVEYASRRMDLAQREERRLHASPALARLARMYGAHFAAVLERYEAASRDLLGGFVRLARATPTLLELITCPGTHPFAPLYAHEPEMLAPHLLVARSQHAERTGALPRTLWLAECGYAPAFEPLLREHDVQATVLDAHALMYAAPPARCGPFAPVVTPGGLVVCGRDPVSAQQIWSRKAGYPAHADYREFHLDLADVLAREQLGDVAHPAGHRLPTGFKYWRIGERGNQPKQPYVPERAAKQAHDHAAHFVATTRRRAAELAQRLCHHQQRQRTVLVMPFDAELFGHWWFEGPSFLDAVVRGLATSASTGVQMQRLCDVTAGETVVVERQVVEPTTSSWGMHGYAEMWLNERTDAYQTRLWELGRKIRTFAQTAPADVATSAQARQLVTELMLAQASDWPFLLRTGTHATYAAQRLEEHLNAAQILLATLQAQAPLKPNYLESRQQRTPHWPQATLAPWQ